MLTAQSGRMTCRLDRAALTSAAPKPSRESTPRFAAIVRNSPLDSFATSASPSRIRRPSTHSVRTDPKLAVGSGSAMSTTAAPSSPPS